MHESDDMRVTFEQAENEEATNYPKNIVTQHHIISQKGTRVMAWLHNAALGGCNIYSPNIDHSLPTKY